LEKRERNVYGTQALEHAGRNAGPGSATNQKLPAVAVQIVLADILEDPGRELVAWVQTRFPSESREFYAEIIKGARGIIDEVIDGLQKSTRGEASPTLLDRLSFSWQLLRRADVRIWKTKKADIPSLSRFEHADAIFRNILSVPLQQPLLTALVQRLRLGSNAEYLYHYSIFRRGEEPSRLPNPFGNISKNKNFEVLRTLIWWCLRARREKYVEVQPKEPVRIEFAYVIEEVVQDLKRWSGPEIEEIEDLTGEVERELNNWLSYSRLEFGLDEGAPDGVDPELARAFIKHNELTTKLRVVKPSGHSEHDERTKQLEAQVRQYAEENRLLEERLRSTEGVARTAPAGPIDSDQLLSSFTEIREVLKIVDTKYAFDTLNSVQLGEQTHLTLRSFVTHLFYALRKRGFAEYPKEEEFLLTYESSGLYDCDGFEVPPSGSLSVKVTRKGWAFNVRGKWLPVRRARVIPVRPKDSQRSSE
jgi:hypothetical protein